MIPLAKPQLGAEEQAAVAAVLASGMIAHGPVTEAFEKEFAAYIGTRHAVAVSNGTAALHVALSACGIGPGDEVITTPFTFVATANAILYAGAKPVFADVDARTFNLDPACVAKAITPRTKAILPVHLYGLPTPSAPLLDLAKDHDLQVIEDCAQAHGATDQGRRVGSLGRAGCFSMYPTKNMTTGEGGMITTDDDAVADLARSLRNHGRGLATLGTYDHVRQGHNFRSTDLASAIGRVQLGRLPGFNAARQANAKAFDEVLQGHAALRAPHVPAGLGHVYHQYTVTSQRRAALQEHLKARGIGSAVYYPKVQYHYPHLVGFAAACPVAERLTGEVLSLPVHPGLTAADRDAIRSALRAWP